MLKMLRLWVSRVFMLKRHHLISVVLITVGLVAAGCRTADYRYTPDVAEAELSPDRKELSVKAFVTIQGIEPPIRSGRKPERISFRLRLENTGSSPVRLLRESIDLLSEDLNEFGEPDFRDEADGKSFKVPPSDSRLLNVSFSVPPDKNVTSQGFRRLTLLWTIKAGEKTYRRSVTFKRSRIHPDVYHRRRFYGDWYYSPFHHHHHYYYHHRGGRKKKRGHRFRRPAPPHKRLFHLKD